jgi:hypothetical protein
VMWATGSPKKTAAVAGRRLSGILRGLVGADRLLLTQFAESLTQKLLELLQRL